VGLAYVRAELKIYSHFAHSVDHLTSNLSPRLDYLFQRSQTGQQTSAGRDLMIDSQARLTRSTQERG
jgi:hypothetical protein